MAAQAAGFTDITATASAWCFATSSDLQTIAAAWREWSSHEDGWFAVLHGEVLARTPR